MSEDYQLPSANWYPVEPALTHCLEILSVALDLKSERSSEGLQDGDFNLMKQGDPSLWQRVDMRITAINAGTVPSDRILFQTAIQFSNVVMFNFQESEFDRGSPISHVLNQAAESIYHNDNLSKEAGFSGEKGTSPYGAFCLWVCDESPVVDQMIRDWKPWIDSEDKRRVFRHYKIGADDLGQFNIVCTGAFIERLA